jgi:hypothetical protein
MEGAACQMHDPNTRKMESHDWNYYTLDDFQKLLKASITHPLMNEIESALK